jgi:hypothetical protein
MIGYRRADESALQFAAKTLLPKRRRIVAATMTVFNTALCLVPFLFLTIVHSQAPANDECTNATVIPPAPPSYPYVSAVTNYFRATVNPDDPKPPCFVDFNEFRPDYTVWFRWTPSTTGVFTFNTFGSVLDPTLPYDDQNLFPESFVAIFKGGVCSSLELMACSNAYLTKMELQGNQTYSILVSQSEYRTNFDTKPGYLVLTVNPTPAAPANDECATAVVVPPVIATPYTTAFAVDIDRATQNNATDKTCQLAKGDSVWARWTPASSGTYDFTTVESRSIYNYSFYAQIAIYSGDSCVTAKEVACKDSTIKTFYVIDGRTYWIKVQAEDPNDNNGGTVRLDIQRSAVRLGFFRSFIRYIRALLFG